MKDYVNPGSATFWSGIALVGFGVFLCATGEPQAGTSKILEGLGLIFLRRAVGASGGLSR